MCEVLQNRKHVCRSLTGSCLRDTNNVLSLDNFWDSLLLNRRERAVGFVSRVVWWSRRLWPRVLRRVMARKVQKFAARNRRA